jgi:hypothetical protein
LPTDQSEAELLYFNSLFFSVKKPFQKTKFFESSENVFGEGDPHLEAWEGVGEDTERSYSAKSV